MADQINIKLDPKLKRQAELLSKQLGLSLSGVLRAFLCSFVRTKKIEFSLIESNPSVDTPASLTGKDLMKQLKKAGYSAKYAEEHGLTFDKMLKDEHDGSLIEL
ncbi:type II toxin-antitoxin system RelB/DinJ family antitoxin [Patescibacteria group bacterium]|nr:type II toxin-antitoxin system RelB/DinJ family antitoxin [Patescibacteria group bacterium]MBU1124057.1 type II toxin-antitoxin system RelB/DinJ family antitoxin [Patescibacteria group bacterium]